MLEQTRVLFIQGLLPPGTGTTSACRLLPLRFHPLVGFFLPLQLFLLQLQLQHDSTQLHVQVVSSLQLPLVVLADI